MNPYEPAIGEYAAAVPLRRRGRAIAPDPQWVHLSLSLSLSPSLSWLTPAP